MLDAFALAPGIVHLNHGSFGACPVAALDAQARWRARIEAATMRFFVLEWPDALAEARAAVAAFLEVDPAGLVFVPNATTGVATALDALIAPGGEVLVTDHAYPACRNAVDRLAAARGATVRCASIDFPVADPAAPMAAILAAITPATRLLLVDHVTSPTALVLDPAAIARAAGDLGRAGAGPVGEAAVGGVAGAEPTGAPAARPPIDVVVDGAHAPGMRRIDTTGVAAYAGNLHKWACAPKGAGFLWVRDDLRERVRPLVTSHGATVAGAARFHAEHDWTGTHDPTAYLSAPAAIDELARRGGGWDAVRAHNHALARAMRDQLAVALGTVAGAPDALTGSMATLPITLPDGADPRGFERDLLRAGYEAPIVAWRGGTYLRVSAHLYNTLDDARRLADHLLAVGLRPWAAPS
jgi:isopenicillin-N epimerase